MLNGHIYNAAKKHAYKKTLASAYLASKSDVGALLVLPQSDLDTTYTKYKTFLYLLSFLSL